MTTQTPDAVREAVAKALDANVPVGQIDARTRSVTIANVLAALDSRAGDAGEVRIPRNVAILIDQAFLPSNPARMRAAAPEVIEAAKAFKAILATTVPAAR